MILNKSNRASYRLKITFDTDMIQVTRAELSSIINKSYERTVIITDLVFMKRHAVFFRGLPSGIPILQIDVKPNTKNLLELNRIYDFLLQKQVQRSMHVYVFGGGTLTDLAAFAVSTFKRGTSLTLIPTTVVGMVDASLGGKTAYDFNHMKNIIGTFFPAESVYFCHDFLKTLEPVDILNGWAEIVKMFLIHKSMELPELLNIMYLPPKELVWQAAKLKMEICASDLQDKEKRRLLNLGHTFGHILESVSLCEIPHGLAIVFGIHAAALLSFRMNFIPENMMNRIRNLFHEFPLSQYVTEELITNLKKNGLQALLQDKKAENDLKLVLFKDWRVPEVVDIAEPTQALECLADVLKEYLTN